jgi:hypothetical protein
MMGLPQPAPGKEATMIEVGKELAHLAQQPSDERLRALKRIIPRAVIQSTLKTHGCDRGCARLPKWFVVWFVLGLGLFASDSYRQIYRWLQRFRPGQSAPGRSTLCEARQRLGVAPLRYLFDRVVKLLTDATTPEAFYGGYRLMALDGFVVDVPDSPANARVFGRPGNARAPGAFPQARVLALCEVGSHVLWRYQVKPVRRGEIALAPTLLWHLSPDMLLLWDRGLLSFANVAQVLACGAQLLARAKNRLVFAERAVLADGSCLVQLYPCRADRLAERHGVTLRLIEYTFHDPSRTGSGQKHRLLTTLLDEKAHPAEQLIVLYHERWEEEVAIDEVKTHQRQRPVLRSQTPAGVVQELAGLLLGHYVVRALMAEAAAAHQIAPRRVSFTGALQILRCRLPECPRSVAGLERWYKNLVAEIGEEILPPRRDRINPRVIRRKMSKWLKKRDKHRHHPQPTKKFSETIEIIS